MQTLKDEINFFMTICGYGEERSSGFSPLVLWRGSKEVGRPATDFRRGLGI